ncbi:MAG: energy transducer TonB [Bacteroidales bacterium]
MKTKKSPHANLENKRPFFLEIGLIIALASVLLAFEWKKPATIDNAFEQASRYKPEEDILIPNTHQKPPPPPKNNTQSFELDIVNDKVEVTNELKFDVSADQNTVIDDFSPPHVPDKPVKEKLFIVVQEEPEFKGGPSALKKFLRENIEYPEQARRLGIEGTVHLSFIVDKDGSIRNATINRGVGGGCSEEALRLLRNMPRWKPGKQRGKAVPVKFNLPIKFKLAE